MKAKVFIIVFAIAIVSLFYAGTGYACTAPYCSLETLVDSEPIIVMGEVIKIIKASPDAVKAKPRNLFSGGYWGPPPDFVIVKVEKVLKGKWRRKIVEFKAGPVYTCAPSGYNFSFQKGEKHIFILSKGKNKFFLAYFRSLIHICRLPDVERAIKEGKNFPAKVSLLQLLTEKYGIDINQAKDHLKRRAPENQEGLGSYLGFNEKDSKEIQALDITLSVIVCANRRDDREFVDARMGGSIPYEIVLPLPCIKQCLREMLLSTSDTKREAALDIITAGGDKFKDLISVIIDHWKEMYGSESDVYYAFVKLQHPDLALQVATKIFTEKSYYQSYSLLYTLADNKTAYREFGNLIIPDAIQFHKKEINRIKELQEKNKKITDEFEAKKKAIIENWKRKSKSDKPIEEDEERDEDDNLYLNIVVILEEIKRENCTEVKTKTIAKLKMPKLTEIDDWLMKNMQKTLIQFCKDAAEKGNIKFELKDDAAPDDILNWWNANKDKIPLIPKPQEHKPEPKKEPEENKFSSEKWMEKLLPPFAGLGNNAKLILQGNKKITIDAKQNIYRVAGTYKGEPNPEPNKDYTIFTFELSADRVMPEDGLKKIAQNNNEPFEIIQGSGIKGSASLAGAYVKLCWLHNDWLFTMEMSSSEKDVDENDMKIIAINIAQKIISLNKHFNKDIDK